MYKKSYEVQSYMPNVHRLITMFYVSCETKTAKRDVNPKEFVNISHA